MWTAARVVDSSQGIDGTSLERALGKEISGFCHRSVTARVFNKMSHATRKRSYKRAIRRALRDGSSRYKGKLITRKQLLLQGYEPNHVVPSNPQMLAKHKPKPGEQGRAPRLKIFSWNCGGLSTDKYDALLVHLRDVQIDIATVQETRWGFTGEWISSGYFCFHSGLQDNSTKRSGEAGGVLTLVRTNLSSINRLRWCAHVPGRLLQVRIPFRDQHVDIFNVYQRFCPRGAEVNVKEEFHAFWLSLDDVLSMVPKRNILLLSGDFNARVSSMGSLVGACVGRTCASGSPPDPELMAILEKHQLCALNTWAATTELSSVGVGGFGNIVDFITIRLANADARAKSVVYDRSCPLLFGLQTYHVPLRTTVSLHWKCWRHTPKPSVPKLDIAAFMSDVASGSDKYVAYLRELEFSLKNASLESVDEVMTSVCCKYYAKSPRKSSQSVNVMEGSVRATWSLWRELLGQKRRDLRGLFKCWYLSSCLLKRQRLHRRERRQAKRVRLEAAIDQAKKAVDTGNQRALHGVIRRLSPKQPLIKLQLRGPSGELLSPEDEQIQVKQYMTAQFMAQNVSGVHPLLCETVPFTEMELIQSLKRLPTYKAVPSHCVPSAMVKHSADVLGPFLYHKCVDDWQAQVACIPKMWRSSWLCWIPKPGKSHTSMKGWRGISLQSALGKAILWSITQQAKIHCYPSLVHFPQFAYIAQRSTGEAILRSVAHCDRAVALARSVHATHHEMRDGRAKGKLSGGFQLCLDIDGAFDKVHRTTLFKALSFLQVPDSIIALLMNWHQQTSYFSDISGSEIEVDANIGVRQGCVAAPLLWTSFTHVVMFVLSLVFPMAWIRSCLTFFADDLHASWTFTNEDELQKNLAQLRILLDLLQVMGIKINVDKSVVLLHMRGSSSSKWRSKILRRLNGKMQVRLPPPNKSDTDVVFLPLVKEHKYLGIMLSYVHLQDATLRHRTRLAQHTFIRLRRWWKTCLPLHARINLWYQVVWPTLTYGLADTGLSKRGILKFQAVIFRQLRSIVKSPLHLTRESNRSLVIRLGILDPLVHLGCSTLRIWQRRLCAINSSYSDDVLRENISFCRQFTESLGAMHSWYKWCIYQWVELKQWHQTSPTYKVSKMHDLLAEDMETIAEVLGVAETLRKCRPDTSHSTTIGWMNEPPELQALPAPEPLQCELCSMTFAHQMALRKHMLSAHDVRVDPINFDMARDALDGLPTCRHCGHKFRYWLGLRQHISLQVCSNFRDGNPVHQQTSCLCDSASFRDRLKNQDWTDIINDDTFQNRARQHCAFCNQWFPRVSSLGYHLQRAHPEEYRQGRHWFAERVAHKDLIKQTPCHWCGCVLARSSLPKHRCPVGVQLGALLFDSTSGASKDGARGSGRTSSEHLRSLPTQQWRQRGAPKQEASQQSVTKRPSSRIINRQRPGQGQGQGQEQEERQEGGRRRWVSTESRPYGDQGRRPHEPSAPRYGVHVAFSHYCSSTTLSTSNYEAMEVHERRRPPQARPTTSQHPTSLCVRGAVQNARPARRLRSKRPHQSPSRHRSLRRVKPLHETGVGPECPKAQDSGGSPLHSRGHEDPQDTHPTTSRSRHCTSLPLSTTISGRVQGQSSCVLSRSGVASSSVRTGLLGAPAALRSEYHGAYPLQAQEARTEEITFSAGDSGTAQCSRQAWQLNGRGDAVVASFRNPGNSCYYISVMVSLIRCMTEITFSPSQLAWGFLSDIWRLVSHEAVASLEALAPFKAAISHWEAPSEQHDAAEFAHYIGQRVPVLATQRVQSRSSLAGHVQVEWTSPHAYSEPLAVATGEMQSLSALLATWHQSEGFLKAYVISPPLLFLHLDRFYVEAGRSGKRAEPIALEEFVRVPVFLGDTLEVEWQNYKAVAYIIHHGTSWRNGHYTTAVQCDGGFVLVDDHDTSRYQAHLTVEQSSNIYLAFLIKAT